MLHHFFRIWYRPRETVHAALETASSKRIHLLAAGFGIVGFFENAVKGNYGNTLPFHWILVLALVAGAPTGILALYLLSLLLRWTGKFLRGRASLGALRTALAYSWIPILWSIPIYAATIGIYGREAFISKQTTTPQRFI